MIVDRIDLAGFRGFRDRATVQLAPGFNVIQGANGAGKSTLCDALEFCLTGGMTKYAIEKGTREKVQDYFWWRGDGKAREHFVRITFKREDGSIEVVERNREGCSRSDEELRGLFCLDDAPSDAMSVLLDTTIIRDESISALSLDLSDSDRYSRVQRALGAVNTDRLLARAASVSRVVDERQRGSSSHVDALRARMSDLLMQRSEAQTQLSHSEAAPQAATALSELLGIAPHDHAALIKAARSYYGDRQSWMREIVSASDRAIAISGEIDALSSATFEQELQGLDAQVSLLREQVGAATSAYALAEAAVRSAKNADALASAYAKLLEHGEHVGLQDGHCPLCRAERTPDEFQEAIAIARELLDGRGGEAASAQTRAEAERRRVVELEEQLNVSEVALSTLQRRLESIARLRVELDGIASRFSVPLHALMGEEALRPVLHEAREKMLQVEGHARTLIGTAAFARISELQASIDATQIEVDKSEQSLAQHRRALVTSKSVESSIKRTAANIVDERLAEINPLLSELYLRLKPHGDWKNIEYKIRGDVKKFLSLAVGEELNPQFVFSSGQRRVTGLAFLLSVHLSRRWCSWNSLVLDDPVQHIDDFRALNLVEVLSSIRMNGRQVICAVEDVALADLLCRRLRAVNENDGARICVEQGPAGVSMIGSVSAVKAGTMRVLDVLSPQSSVG